MIKRFPPWPLVLATLLAGVAGFAGARWLGPEDVWGEGRRADGNLSGRAMGAVENETNVAGAPAEKMDGKTSGAGLAILALPSIPSDKEFFREAAKAFEAIEQLSAADFTTIAASGKLPEIIGGGPEQMPFKVAVREAFVARWLAMDPEGAVPAMVAMSSLQAGGQRMAGARALRNTLAELRPEAFLAAGAKLAPAETKNNYDWPWMVAYTALARTQPEAVRRLAADLPKEKQREATQAIAMGVAESDPVAAMKLVKNDNVSRVYDYAGSIAAAAVRSAERAGPGVIRQMLEAGRDGQTLDRNLAGLYARHPELAEGISFSGESLEHETSGRAEVRAVLDQLPVAELQRRLQAEDKIPGKLRAAMVGQLVEAWAVNEPAAATAWAMARAAKQTGPDDFTPAQKAFAVWREQEPAAAQAWLQALPASDQKTALSNRVALSLMQRGDLDAALAAYVPETAGPKFRESFSLSYGADSMSCRMTSGISELDLLGYAASQRNPGQAVAWAAALPECPGQSGTLRRALSVWMERDAEQAAQWVEALPAGLQRDVAYGTMANGAVTRDRAAAAEWADAMADPTRRADWVRSLYGQLLSFDPPGARAWLRARPGLTTEEKEQVIRRNR